MMQFFKRVQGRVQLSRSVLFAILAVILCLLGFGVLAEDTGEHGVLVQFDTALDNQLHATMTAQIAPVYRFISLFGSELVIAATLIPVIYYASKRRWLFVAVWLMAIAGGYALNFLLKAVFNRSRPPYANVFVQESSTSFPSGHAMISVIFYGMFVYCFFLAVKNLRIRIVIVFSAVLAVVVIGISRLYLGVHYPSDVIGGYLAGVAWLSVCIATMSLIQVRRRKAELRETA